MSGDTEDDRAGGGSAARDASLMRAVGSLEGQIIALNTRVGEANRTTLAAVVALRTDVDKVVDNMNERLTSHSNRLRDLERRQSWFLGGMALFVTAAGLFVAFFDRLWPPK